MELSLEGAGIVYEPGDSLGFLPCNDPVLVDAVMGASGVAGFHPDGLARFDSENGPGPPRTRASNPATYRRSVSYPG